MNDKQASLRNLQQADFVMLEAGLYLNGYPTCREALEYFEKAKCDAKSARCAHEEKFGPLTLSSAGGDTCWTWVASPLPWEWEAN